MPRTHEHPLLVALRTAMDNARPVRGKDETALRSADWHAVEREIRKAAAEMKSKPTVLELEAAGLSYGGATFED